MEKPNAFRLFGFAFLFGYWLLPAGCIPFVVVFLHMLHVRALYLEHKNKQMTITLTAEILRRFCVCFSCVES